MTTPLPPEREGSPFPPPAGAGGEEPRSGEGEGLSWLRSIDDKAYDRLPTQRSRDLRNHATPAERKLWNALSNRKLCGVRFNRQVAIKPYICDLVARSQKLVIELDGGQHGDAIAYDAARTAFLHAKGYRVLRFWNNDVMGNLDGVVTKIEEALRFPPPARAGGVDSPQADGGGNVALDQDIPSPSRHRAPMKVLLSWDPFRRSSPPALAGGG